MKLEIHSIAACCNSGGIGLKNQLPWKLRKEFQHFVKLTTGNPPEGKQNVVVMGRKTWLSIPYQMRPLKDRFNFVMTRDISVKNLDGAHEVVHSLEELVEKLESSKWKNRIHEIFNVGGSEIYKLIQDSSYCGNVFLTRVFGDFQCDTFFPSLKGFEKLAVDKFPQIPQEVVEEKGLKWKVEVYHKI